jgi:ABC-type nitrate/sulfonate/bicarbonate transport system permease component
MQATDSTQSTLSAASLPPSTRRPGASLQRGIKGAAGIFVLLVLWQASVPWVGLEPYLYPAPFDVWQAFLELMRKGILPVYIWDTLGRYVLGVTIGISAGIVLGLLIGLNELVQRVMGPAINFMFAIVEVAWIPIFVVWWGYGLKTIVIALVYVTFFPVLYNTIVGVRTVPQVMINATRSLGAGHFAVLREVILPSALPNIITGVRVGAGFAFRGLIFAEIIAAKTGVGYLIFEGANSQQTARTVVGMIVMGLMWLFIDKVYIKPVEKVSIERWRTVTTSEDRG